jgi:hypothetical protein
VTRLERSIELNVPADVAWMFVSDPRRAQPALTDDQASVTLLSGSYEAVGGRYLVTTAAGDGTIEAEYEITRYDPPEQLDTTVTSRGTVARSRIRVDRIDQDRCRLTMSGEMEWGRSVSHLFGRIVNALWGGVLLRHSLERLGAAITISLVRDGGSGRPEAHLGEKG